jgi:hypothetical protein
VTIQPPPTASIIGIAQVCVGEQISLQANASGAAPFSFIWSIQLQGQATVTVLSNQTGVVINSNPTNGHTELTIDAGTAFGGLAMGLHTVFLNIANVCDDITLQSTIGVSSCDSFCSFTQGYWGNNGGKGSPRVTLLNSLLSQGPLVLGKAGQSLTITSGQAACVIKKMPGGGPTEPLPAGDHVFDANCTDGIPVNKGGRWRNNLLSQTLALSLNVRYDSNALGNWVLQSQFCTMGTDGQSGITSHTIDASVLTALTNLGLPRTVNGLIELANRALAGQPTGGADLSAIAGAAGAINEGFDECRRIVLCVPQ